MNRNKLLVAAAGSGKTTFIVEESLKQKERKILITTYTQANEAEVRRKIIEKNKFIPENIIVQTWYSFRIRQLRPTFSHLNDKRRLSGNT